MISIPVAIKIQRLKVAFQWVIAAPDVYQQVRVDVMDLVQGEEGRPALSPIKGQKTLRAVGDLLRGISGGIRKELSEWISQDQAQRNGIAHFNATPLGGLYYGNSR